MACGTYCHFYAAQFTDIGHNILDGSDYVYTNTMPGSTITMKTTTDLTLKKNSVVFTGDAA